MNDRTGLTRNSILRISDEKTIQLIQEWEKEECLWNTDLKDYPNIEERVVATEIIAERLAIPNFKPEHVTAKLKNLRNSYSQELKKMAVDQNYKPKVFWFSYMDKFLRPHLQKVKKLFKSQDYSTTGIKAEIICDDDDQDWSIDNTTQSEASGSCSRSESTFSDLRNSELYKLIQSGQNGEKLLQSERKRKRKLSNETTTLSENEEVIPKCLANDVEIQRKKVFLMQDFSSSASPRQPEHRKEDYLDSFGAYVASLLRSLPRKTALMLQPAITELIVSIGVEESSNSDSDSEEYTSN